MNRTRLSYRSRIPLGQLDEIIQGTRAMTPVHALRLAVALQTSALYWMLLQTHHDMQNAVRLRKTDAVDADDPSQY